MISRASGQGDRPRPASRKIVAISPSVYPMRFARRMKRRRAASERAYSR
jgi:hypothetical protein